MKRNEYVGHWTRETCEEVKQPRALKTLDTCAELFTQMRNFSLQGGYLLIRCCYFVAVKLVPVQLGQYTDGQEQQHRTPVHLCFFAANDKFQYVRARVPKNTGKTSCGMCAECVKFTWVCVHTGNTNCDTHTAERDTGTEEER